MSPWHTFLLQLAKSAESLDKLGHCERFYTKRYMEEHDMPKRGGPYPFPFPSPSPSLGPAPASGHWPAGPNAQNLVLRLPPGVTAGRPEGVPVPLQAPGAAQGGAGLGVGGGTGKGILEGAPVAYPEGEGVPFSGPLVPSSGPLVPYSAPMVPFSPSVGGTPGRKVASAASTPASRAVKTAKTLMFFEGTPYPLACTVSTCPVASTREDYLLQLRTVLTERTGVPWPFFAALDADLRGHALSPRLHSEYLRVLHGITFALVKISGVW